MHTRLCKVPAHKGHLLNEATDAAAPRIALEADTECVVVCHHDSNSVRFVFSNQLVEWGPPIRAHILAKIAHDQAASMRSWQQIDDEEQPARGTGTAAAAVGEEGSCL